MKRPLTSFGLVVLQRNYPSTLHRARYDITMVTALPNQLLLSRITVSFVCLVSGAASFQNSAWDAASTAS